MPIYEYKCDKCGVFEKFQPITAEALDVCPDCGSDVQRLISRNVNVLYKTGGFYTTDNRKTNCGSCAEDKCEGSSGSKVS